MENKKCNSCCDPLPCNTCEFNCDLCVDGRDIEIASEYASTCDGCQEVTHHELLTMDMKTQLGYCSQCVKQLDKETLGNLEKT